MVLYCKSVHFHGFEQARLHGKCYEMSSFSESKAKRLAKEAGTVNMVGHCTSEKNGELLHLKLKELFITALCMNNIIFT